MMTYIILPSYRTIPKKAINKQYSDHRTKYGVLSNKTIHITSNDNPEPIRDQITPSKTDQTASLASLPLPVAIDRRTNTPHSLDASKWYVPGVQRDISRAYYSVLVPV